MDTSALIGVVRNLAVGGLCWLVKSISHRGQDRHFFQQQEKVANRGVVRCGCAEFGLGTAVPWKGM